MKKWIASLLIAVLLPFTAAFAGSEDLTGTWYAKVSGMVLILQLNADGQAVMKLGEETIEEGKWTAEEGKVYINKGQEDEGALDIKDGHLVNEENALDFGREVIEPFAPPAKMAAEKPEAFDGTWNLTYVSAMGYTMDAATAISELGDITGIVSEQLVIKDGAATILGAEKPRQFEFVDGHLYAAPFIEGDKEASTIDLGEDGTLMLHMNEMDFYFTRAEQQ